MGRNILTIARIHPSNFRLSKYHAIMPPVAAEIFSKKQWRDFLTRSLRSVYITTWQILLFLVLVQPFITALSALFECSSHAGEQFSISVAVIVLIVFLSPCTVAGVKHLVLFSAGSGGCAYSVGGEFRCHSNAVLVFYNQYPIFKCYIGVGYLPLFQP